VFRPTGPASSRVNRNANRAGCAASYWRNVIGNLPEPIKRYFSAEFAAATDETDSCFTSDAVVWDSGEAIELRGLEAIRTWMQGNVSTCDMTAEVQSMELREGRQVVRAVVTGNFPGSPYAFDYAFLLRDDKVAELSIDPVGPVVPVSRN
jgi:ketosteroid isomerase-like protein